MIGRTEWFQRRKYGGWGLTPKTWQGYAYIGAIVILMIGFQNFPGISEALRMTLTYVFIAVMCLDLLHIMATLKKDELEIKIEALSERNAAWTMIAILVIGLAYQVAKSTVNGDFQIDWFLIAALAGGTIAKSLSNLWLEHKGI